MKFPAPDVGTIIEVDDQWALGGVRRYRVSSWMKAAPPRERKPDPMHDILDDILYDSCRKFTADNVRLVWCRREEAEYLSCSGVAGAIIRVGEFRVVGRVSWPEAQIEEARSSALRKVGEMLS